MLFGGLSHSCDEPVTDFCPPTLLCPAAGAAAVVASVSIYLFSPLPGPRD